MQPARLRGLPRQRLPGGLIVLEAATVRSRLLGLAFLDRLDPDTALLITPCRSVHSFGMRFPLDVALLDRHGRTLRVAASVQRGRVVGAAKAYGALETRAGRIDRFLAAGAGELVAELTLPPPAAAAGS